MITQEQFSTVLMGLSRLLPQYKHLDAMALGLAWMTFPAKAKEEQTHYLHRIEGNRRLSGR